MSDVERRCIHCGRPVVRNRGVPLYGHGEWMHRAITPDVTDFYYCTITPDLLLSLQAHAEPESQP